LHEYNKHINAISTKRVDAISFNGTIKSLQETLIQYMSGSFETVYNDG